MKLKVKFSLYGKNMQTEVEALSRLSAINQIKEKIIFHEIIEVDRPPMTDYDIKDFFNGIFK